MPDVPQYDMIGVRLADACEQALESPLAEGFAKLCECIQSYAQQPGVKPCGTYPLFVRGAITQLATCHIASTAFQVPKGQVAVITRIRFAERYPGTLYGANFFLLINDNISPDFPRMDHSVGSMETGVGTRICLEEQDLVSIMVQCSWTPAVASSITSTYVQTIFPFEIEGYLQLKTV